jgi:replicative DNA helicase
MVGIINAGEYGRAVYDTWLRRQLIDVGETMVNNAFGAEPELDGKAQIEVAEHSLFRSLPTVRRVVVSSLSRERSPKRSGARNAPSTAPAMSRV